MDTRIVDTNQYQEHREYYVLEKWLSANHFSLKPGQPHPIPQLFFCSRFGNGSEVQWSLRWMSLRLRTVDLCGWAVLKHWRRPLNWLSNMAKVHTSYSRIRQGIRTSMK